jgi:hypothetical protein
MYTRDGAECRDSDGEGGDESNAEKATDESRLDGSIADRQDARAI